jgi:hypothetical protein
LTTAKRALGSTSWGVAGNLAGGLLVIWILINFASIANVLLLMLILIVALPFFVGLLTFRAIRWSATRDARHSVALRRPAWAELSSTNMVLAGVYPVVIILIDRWLEPWYLYGFGLTNPLLWGILSLGAIIGVLTAYPIHVWMIRRGLIRWEIPSLVDGDTSSIEPGATKLPWFKALGIAGITFAVLIAIIILSLSFS